VVFAYLSEEAIVALPGWVDTVVTAKAVQALDKSLWTWSPDVLAVKLRKHEYLYRRSNLLELGAGFIPVLIDPLGLFRVGVHSVPSEVCLFL
jgi:hypothetical protein